MDETLLSQRSGTMRAWVRRRLEAHKPVLSDELWARIKYNWPTMAAEDQEKVFNNAVLRSLE